MVFGWGRSPDAADTGFRQQRHRWHRCWWRHLSGDGRSLHSVPLGDGTDGNLGRCMGFGSNKYVIWTLQEYQTTFRIQDGFKGIGHSQGFLANQLLNTVKIECWLSTRQNVVVYFVLMLEDCVVISHWEIRCSRGGLGWPWWMQNRQEDSRIGCGSWAQQIEPI